MVFCFIMNFSNYYKGKHTSSTNLLYNNKIVIGRFSQYFYDNKEKNIFQINKDSHKKSDNLNIRIRIDFGALQQSRK